MITVLDTLPSSIKSSNFDEITVTLVSINVNNLGCEHQFLIFAVDYKHLYMYEFVKNTQEQKNHICDNASSAFRFCP